MIKPLEGQCPVCQSIFKHSNRPQGGGQRRIYCSPKCRSLDWIRGNGGKRQASVTKYDNKPESKEKKRARSRKAKLAKYGLTDGDLEAMLSNQPTCKGCLLPLTMNSARIDHCHTTGVVRGLLCDHCNWAVGHAKDSPDVLRRLAAYLE